MQVQGKGEEHPNITQRPRRGLREHPHRLHRGFAEDSQRTHRGLAEDSEDSQRIRRGLAEDPDRGFMKVLQRTCPQRLC